jgi:hypothetical protein
MQCCQVLAELSGQSNVMNQPATGPKISIFLKYDFQIYAKQQLSLPIWTKPWPEICTAAPNLFWFLSELCGRNFGHWAILQIFGARIA